MRSKITILIFITLAIFTTCNSQHKKVTILMETSMGNIKLKLYDETPKHRDNFVRLIKAGFYNQRIFHRVIKNFMIQGGDKNLPENSTAKTPTDSFNYTIPAEINRNLLHKRGVLAAAREGDNVNPLQESSATQFYIVQGEKLSEEKLDQIEKKIGNSIIRKNFLKILKEESKEAEISNSKIEQNAKKKAMEIYNKNPFHYSKKEREKYLKIGGTPHLDMNYTVFGEVISGMDVVDKIAEQLTDNQDKPITDIKFTIRIIE